MTFNLRFAITVLLSTMLSCVGSMYLLIVTGWSFLPALLVPAFSVVALWWYSEGE